MKTLLDRLAVDCVMIDRTSVPDGMGGVETAWVDGAPFKATIVKNTTLDAKVAEKQGVTDIYTVTVNKGSTIHYHDIFRRESDGQIFRITSDLKDTESPDMSQIDKAHCSAEEWELT